jgi:hypothetical protein
MDTEDMAALHRKLETTDAMVWAQEWCKVARQIATREQSWAALDDEGWMVGWFANAIMRGYDEGVRKEAAKTSEALTEQARLRDLLVKLERRWEREHGG